MLSIRPEMTSDITQIRQVVSAAFGRTNEAKLIDKIRNSPHFIPELSLVAVEEGEVLGHILFSLIEIVGSGKISALALAPLAVIPSHQGLGIGSSLVKTGLLKCQEYGNFIVVVLGEPVYYQSFGFQRASQYGINAPFPVPDEAFMVLELQAGLLKNCTGTVCYPAYFDEV